MGPLFSSAPNSCELQDFVGFCCETLPSFKPKLFQGGLSLFLTKLNFVVRCKPLRLFSTPYEEDTLHMWFIVLICVLSLVNGLVQA